MTCLTFPSRTITFEKALMLAASEMQRRGLSQSHRVAALHSAPDATAEGASFAVSIFPRHDGNVSFSSADGGRWKLLIEHDGQVSVRSWQVRSAARLEDQL